MSKSIKEKLHSTLKNKKKIEKSVRKKQRKKSLKKKIELENTVYKTNTSQKTRNISKNTKHKANPIMSKNANIVDILERMEKIMFVEGAPFKARAYQKAKETVMLQQSEITSIKDVEGKNGFRKGGSVLRTLKEFLDTGAVQKITDSKSDMRHVFTNVYGIGPKMAAKLTNPNGYNVQSIEELRERQDELLNDVQKKGLRYYEDILERIPRKEINNYNKLLQLYFNSVKPKNSKSVIQVVGSWRRGAANSGDIDVIICDADKNSKLFKDFIDLLIEKNKLVEVLSRGNIKTLGISKLTRRSTPRRIDFMFTPKAEFPFAILYFTGSKVFNTLMRKRALDLGYTMNEHGLYHMKNKKKDKRVDVEFTDEQSIFTFLGIQYRHPTERSDGNNFQLIDVEHDENQVVEEGETKQRTRRSKRTKKTAPKKKNQIAEKMIEVFKKKGEKFLKTLNEDTIENMIVYADEQYYNKNKPIMTDEEYDVLREWAVVKFPNNETIQQGHEGINVSACKNKVALPYFLGSMDKIKPDTKALGNWLKKYKGDYVISAKLDGMSALYINSNGVSKLFTRGCGTFGFDISHLIPYVKLPEITDMAVRGELIITKNNFKKYTSSYANERSFAAGMVNGKKLEKSKLKKLDFVAYELIEPVMKPEKQYSTLKKLKFITVINKKLKKITADILSEYLMSWREQYDYIIDGVICIHNKIYPRKNKGNPSHAFAFKKVLSDQVVESRVVDVLWSKTQYGYVKPKIKMQPVKIGGVTITYATAHNAKYIVDNKIGIGSVIQVVRSGDVIPKVHKVVKQASEPKMPDDMQVKWNASGVDLILLDASNDVTVKKKTILGFFKKINVDGLKEGNVNKIIGAGFDTIGKIISMEIEDFMTIPGFKEKMSNKIYNSIRTQIEEVGLPLLMDASNMFGHGMGENRIKLIFERYPDILLLDESNEEKREMIMEIEGFAEKTAMKFVKNIRKFKKFLKENNLEHKMNYVVTEQQFDTSHPLFEKKVLLTGFRDDKLLNMIRGVGGIISSGVSKKLDILIIKDINVTGSKLAKAQKLGGIEIITKNAFLEKYY